VERSTGAKKLLLVLGAALAMGLALLFPAGASAAGGRTAPADPAFVQYLEDARAGDQGRTLGLVPEPIAWTDVPRTHFAPLMARFPDRFAPASTTAADSPLAAVAAAGAQADPAPAAYDLRAAGRLSPVRDQGRYGTCWAFASLASLESSLLPGAANDFSENNMAHRSGFALGYNDGGNSYMAAAYLLRWAGPVSESDDPYAPYAATPNASPGEAAVGTHVHEVLQLPARKSATDNADLKWAVMTYGGVYTSMCWTASAFRDSSDAYFYAGYSSPNHAVTLVGWDDSYPASGFSSRPAGPGAFLVRNSWGTGFGQDGYFWVSYYDTEFAGDSAVFAGAEPAAASERIYQHDPLGWVASYRPAGAQDPSTAWFAAAYTAAEAGTLTAAGFYATAPNAAYEVRVADSVEGIRAAAVSATGTLAVPGYHTVTLDAPIAVSAGQHLVIAVRVTAPGYGFPVAIERPWSGYADATAAAGQSFVSGDGATWTDMTKLIAGTDVCLKGYGSASASPGATPTPAPSATPTPAPDAPVAPVAPTIRVGDAEAGPGTVASVSYLVGYPDAASTAVVRLTIRTRGGAVVRRQTLRGVSVGARHTWRVRAPARRAAYVIVAVAVHDTGPVSKQATATLRVR
jgi:C1A family cysteine protease